MAKTKEQETNLTPEEAIDRIWELAKEIDICMFVRRQGFWDNMRFELAEALAHHGCHFMLPLLDEASGAV